MRADRITILALAFMCSVPSGLAAQGAPRYAEHIWVKPPTQATNRMNLGPGLLGDGDRDHRYTGFYVGLSLGAASTVFSVLWCSDRDNDCSVSRALVLGPVITGVLGLTGAVIGGLFPRHANHATEPQR